MKMFVFSICLMAGVIIGLVVNSIVISIMTQNLLDQADNLPFAEEITESSKEFGEIIKLEEMWKRYNPIISLTVMHDDLEKIDEQLTAMRCAIESANKDEYRFARQQFINRINHLRGLSATGINNIM